jgi:hypothetical protein
MVGFIAALTNATQTTATTKPASGNGSAAPEPDTETVEWLLNDRLRLIDGRTAELAELLVARWTDERQRALLAEQAALIAERKATELSLRRERGEIDEPLSEILRKRLEAEKAERRRRIDAQIANIVEKKAWQIQKWEAEGDFRQAMAVRMSLLDVRAEIERMNNFRRRSNVRPEVLPGAPT